MADIDYLLSGFDAAPKPAPSERVWYRSNKTGQRGYLIQQDGKDMVHLDHPNDYHVVPMSSEWQPDNAVAKLSPMQRAQVAYAADCVLRKFVGEADGRTGEWSMLSDAERIEFVDHGPKKANGIRKALWASILEELKDA